MLVQKLLKHHIFVANLSAREDGHLVARLSETADSDSAPGATPSTIVHTEVEVPSLGIHQAADRGQPEQSQNEGAQSAERRSSPDNNVSLNGKQYGSFNEIYLFLSFKTMLLNL